MPNCLSYVFDGVFGIVRHCKIFPFIGFGADSTNSPILLARTDSTKNLPLHGCFSTRIHTAIYRQFVHVIAYLARQSSENKNDSFLSRPSLPYRFFFSKFNRNKRLLSIANFRLCNSSVHYCILLRAR